MKKSVLLNSIRASAFALAFFSALALFPGVVCGVRAVCSPDCPEK